MKKTTKIISTILSVSLLTVLTAGCQSSSSAAPSTAAATTAAADAAATTAAEKKDKTLYDTVMERGKLIIASSGNFQPYTYIDENGDLVGFDNEVGDKIGEKLGVEVEHITTQYSGCIPGMIAGKWDAVMSGNTVDKRQGDEVDFSTPYGNDSYSAIAKADNSKVTDIFHLEGLNAGAITGTPQFDELLKIGGYASVLEYPGNAEAFLDVKSGRCDVYCCSVNVANSYIKNDATDGPLAVFGEPYAMYPLAMVMPKDEPEFKAAVDKALTELIAEGAIDELAMKYFGSTLEVINEEYVAEPTN